MKDKIRFLVVVFFAFMILSCEKYDLDGFQGKKPPQLVITPAEGVVIFDRTKVSKTNEKVFLIKNTGDKDLVINKVVIAGANAEDFIVKTINKKTIPKGETYKFKVTFQPKTVGDKAAELKITANTAVGEYTVKMKGSTEAGSLKLELVSPKEYDFGTRWGDEETTHNVEVKNTGDLAVSISKVEMNKDEAPGMTIDKSLKFPLLVKAGETKSIPVNYKPIWDGNQTQTMKILSDGGDFQVKLKGKGRVAFIGGVHSWGDGHSASILVRGGELSFRDDVNWWNNIVGRINDVWVEDRKVYAVGGAKVGNPPSGIQIGTYDLSPSIYVDGAFTSVSKTFKKGAATKIYRANNDTYIIGESYSMNDRWPGISYGGFKTSDFKSIYFWKNGVLDNSLKGVEQLGSTIKGIYLGVQSIDLLVSNGTVYVAGKACKAEKTGTDTYGNAVYDFHFYYVLWVDGNPVKVDKPIYEMYKVGVNIYGRSDDGLYQINADGSMQLYKSFSQAGSTVIAACVKENDIYLLRGIIDQSNTYRVVYKTYEVVHNDKVIQRIEVISSDSVSYTQIYGEGKHIYLAGQHLGKEVLLWQDGKVTKIDIGLTDYTYIYNITSMFIVH